MPPKKAEKVVEAVIEQPKKLFENEFGLSFKGPPRGFNIMPEGLLMCNEIFTLLYERFDEEMMKKRVDGEYKGYSVQNAIQTTMNALNISNMTNDKGDDFDEYPIYDFEKYNYEEESEEPTPAKLDTHGLQSKMGDPKILNNRFRMSEFNRRFKSGVPSPTRKKPQKSLRF